MYIVSVHFLVCCVKMNIMEVENKVSINSIIEELSLAFTDESYVYLEKNDTKGDVDNSHKLLENRVLKKEIVNFFYFAEKPLHFTTKELLIYYKFNEVFATVINKDYNSNRLALLEQKLLSYIKNRLKRWSVFMESKYDVNEKENIVNSILEKINAELKVKSKTLKEEMQDRIFRVVMNCYGTPCKIRRAGTPDSEDTTTIFFENDELGFDIKVQTSIKNDIENNEKIQILILDSPELEKLNPFGICVYSYENPKKDTTIYELNKIPKGFVSDDIEFKNDLHFLLLYNKMF